MNPCSRPGRGARLAQRTGLFLPSAGALLILAACDRSPEPAPPTYDSLIEDAESLYRAGEFEGALPLFQEASRDAGAVGDSAAVAVALTWEGLTHWQMGRYSEARGQGEEALALKDRLGLEEELARSLNALGLLAWTEGRLGDAADLHERSLEAARAADDSTGIARSLNNLALVHTDLGDLVLAADRYREARTAFRVLALPQFEARVLGNLAALSMEWGDPVEAEAALKDAFARYAVAEDPVGEANALAQLGVVYAAQGDPQRGLLHLDSALARSRELGLPVEEAGNLEQLANIHRSLGSSRLALELYREAGETYEELGLAYEAGANLRARGSLEVDRGNLSAGAALMESALDLHRGIGAIGEVLLDLLALALATPVGEETGAADRYLAEAEAAAGEIGSPRAALDVALTRALRAERAERWAEVLESLDSVEDLIPDAPSDLRWQAHLLRARALARSGDPEALEEARSAVAIVEQLRGSLGSDLLRNGVAEARADTYHLLVDILLERGRTAEALVASESSRSRAVERRIAMSRMGVGSPQRRREELLTQVGHLDASIHALLSAVAPQDRDAAFRRELDEVTRRRDRARQELASMAEEAAYPGSGRPQARSFADGAGPTGAPLVIPALQAQLAPDEALVSFLVTDDRLLSFVVRRDTLAHVQQEIPLEGLGNRVRVARSLIDQVEDGEGRLRPVLEGLHALLLQPLDDAGLLSGARQLTLVTDGPLAYLPFGALRNPDTGKYLAQRFRLLHVPSAGTLAAMRPGDALRPADGTADARRGAGRPGSPVLAGVVGAGFAPQPDSLPASVGEIERFLAAFRGEAFVGQEATEERLRETLGMNAVLHAAAHASLNVRNPLFSRLRLASGAGTPGDDGVLHVHELLDVPVMSPLVFLSACETGAPSSWALGAVGGRDLSTLSQALLVGGASAVVATLWRIEDRAAAEFAGHFYRSLLDRGPTDALAEAQRALLSNPATASPFYWAGYQVSGGGEWTRQRALVFQVPQGSFAPSAQRSEPSPVE